MTIQKVLDKIHRIRPETSMTVEECIDYINEIECRIWVELVLTHERFPTHCKRRMRPIIEQVMTTEHGTRVFVSPMGNPLNLPMRLPPHPPEPPEPWEYEEYTAEDINEELIAEKPYDILYVDYVKYRLDQDHNNTVNLNNSESMFLTSWYNYANWYNEHYTPRDKGHLHMRGYGI